MRKKTLGPISSELIIQLKQENRNIFSLKDARKVTRTSYEATRLLLNELERKNWLIRLKKGKYLIAPLELRPGSEYMGNWYIVARELIKPHPYYISYYSAMSIHNMLTHPVLAVYISTPIRRQTRKVGNAKLRFVYVKPENIWGTKKVWVTKQEQVEASDLEKTIIDSLSRPSLCGGITEIARGMWVRRSDIDYQKLAGYAKRAGVKAVIKRLGFLLENYRLGREEFLADLRNGFEDSKSYAPLDPLLPKEGRHLARWRVLLNVTPEELSQVIRT